MEIIFIRYTGTHTQTRVLSFLGKKMNKKMNMIVEKNSHKENLGKDI